MSEEYEAVCVVCMRPESKAGKMLALPGNLNVCFDCLQKTIDMAGSMNIDPATMGFPGFTGVPVNAPADNNGDYREVKETDADKDNESTEDAPDKEGEEQEKVDEKFSRPHGFPNISFLNLSDLQGGFPGQKRIKKSKKPLEPIDLKTILPPHKIKEKLDEYVIGQEQAKKIISVAVYNHYKRVATGTMDEIEIEKSNILMIGPTGCGKTYLVKTLAKLLDVPLAIADATSLTEAGYIGDDIESVVSKLLAAADNDVERAERGIIFIDEIDKIAKKKETTSRDVSGESVQQGMLKLLEGAEVEVPIGANSKNAMVPLATVNTRNILFICGGAFPDLEDIVKQRLNKKTSIGYSAELKDKWDHEKNILSHVKVEDIKKFGMIPEFVGRLPVLCPMEMLDKDMLVQILKEPKNAILKQYQKLLELDEVKLEFSDEALSAIAEKAMERDTGARALRAIIEEFMLDIMYEIPKDKNIGTVTITREYIEGTGGPVIELRTESLPTSTTP
ncbi:MAG: ATP-dependent Clp protease ATP-binding subunit ClpX, partial [Lachnospiraceae bacterium]|nr:ATP-dependent Clp protease ATP-binding subunit ClpX [Lachnospiraceae bacterium]